VRERRADPCRRALMAALARQRGLNVIGRLAERRNTVVAARASRRNSGMTKAGCATIAYRAAVAAPAWRIGDHMIRRLADRDRAIVAGRAGRIRLNMIDETQVAPRRRQVAAFTEIRRLRMRWRFSLRARSVMTSETLLRRTLEAPVDVARCAVDARMGPGERKSGREVIE